MALPQAHVMTLPYGHVLASLAVTQSKSASLFSAKAVC